MLIPVWEPVSSVEFAVNLSPRNDRLLVVGGTEKQHQAIQQFFSPLSLLVLGSANKLQEQEEQLKRFGTIDHIFWIVPYESSVSLIEDGVIAKQNKKILELFQMIKWALASGYGSKNLRWTFVTTQAQGVLKQDQVDPTQAGLYGLIGTLAKEYPEWEIRLIDLEESAIWRLEEMCALPLNRYRHPWAYRNNRWFKPQLLPLQDESTNRSLYRAKGVYVVIGGAGYIGEVWSEYMIRTYQAQIIWIGRRQIEKTIQAKLDRLATLGPAPKYYAADATDRQALQKAYEQIKKEHPQIHGVIHAAMIFREQSLERMEIEQFQAELSAKVDVSVRMAQVFQKEPLDFILFFSSLVSQIKNVNQSHYAAGSTFSDAFANQFSKQVSCLVKVMNWGYWGNSEVASDPSFIQKLDQMGLGLIEPKEGMRALEILLSGPFIQMAFLKTTKPLVIEGMNQQESLFRVQKDSSLHLNISTLKIPNERFPNVDKRQDQIDKFLCKLLFVQLGILKEPRIKGGIKFPSFLSKFDRWLHESIQILLRHQFLVKNETADLTLGPEHLDRDILWEEWEKKKRAWLKDDNIRPVVVLADATLKALPLILTGKVAATDIIFPNSSMELVENIYKNNEVADYFNTLLANALVEYLKERLKQDPQAKIRIFEIGAGTGGTSSMLFHKLEPYQKHIEEYCYTDISRAFISYAKKNTVLKIPFSLIRLSM